MTLKHNFDEIVDRRGTNSSKWLKYPTWLEIQTVLPCL